MAGRGRRELRYRFLRHLTDRFARQRASLSRTEAWVLSSFLMPAGWPQASPLRAQASPTRISTPRCTRWTVVRSRGPGAAGAPFSPAVRPEESK